MKAYLPLIGAVILLSPIAVAVAQTPSALSWPVPPIGETCTYRVTTRPTGVVYTRTSTFSDAGRYCFDTVSPKGGETVCVNADGNVIEMANTLSSPHSGFFAWPLTVGKEWEYAFLTIGKSGGQSHFTKRVKVVSYEKVSAGGQLYDAFKIEAIGRRMDGGNAWSETAFYAPSVGKTVKYESSDFDSSEFLGCAAGKGASR